MIMKFRKYSLILFCIVSLVGISACKEKDRFVLNFSHSLHVDENGMSCSDCHGELENGHFKEPDHDTCSDCHSDLIDSNDITVETCGVCHVEKDLTAIGEEEEDDEEETTGVFQHSSSLEGKCTLCHSKNIGKEATQIKEMTRSDVVEAREKAHSSGIDCQACHGKEIGVDIAPSNHSQNWVKRHGVYSAEEDASCTVCHPQESCKECHQSQKPTSHNNLWRIKTHGMEASWDRDTCMTCHKNDYCIGCHKDTQPQSHRANWRDRHCLGCHASDSAGTGCSLCHEGNIRNEGHTENWTSMHNSLPTDFDCLVCHNHL